ncbi:MAG: acyl-CoA thioesterase [Planctomycetes bacterium]|nr:acyl-CoA thioesterase [Planctomycetota bacterium]
MPFETHVRVRYVETDQMGVVYHSHYIVYFEIGRTEAMREIGINYAELEKQGYVLAVTETHCKHKASAVYDDLLTIRTRLTGLSKTRLTFEYEVLRSDDCLTTGSTTLAFLSREKGMKPIRPPKYVLEAAAKALEPSSCR